MNKKELIEKINSIPWDEGLAVDTLEINRAGLIQLIEQLDEPQKPVVPQFVADYIEESRLKGWDLLASMCFVLNAKNKKTTKWFYLGENKNIFALAWINGYAVEEEKRYLVKLKGMVEDFVVLKLDKIRDGWYLGNDTEYSYTKVKHTRKELEDAGFGWIFDCPGIEIEEVE